MKYQKQFSSVIEKFRTNEECLQYFLSCFEIPELKNLKNLRCSMFSDNLLARKSDPEIEGFVIFNNDIEVYFISPSANYIGFWGFRNFFTYKLAVNHKHLNDGVYRYVLNVHNKQDLNRKDSFNEIREFWIYNIHKYTEDLRSWILALYKD